MIPAAHELADALSCPICLGLLVDPLIAACCQNNFCRHCLQSTLRSKPQGQCPLCRAPLMLENTLPNRALRNLLPRELSQDVKPGEEAAEATATPTFRPIASRLSSSRHYPGLLVFLLLLSTVCLIVLLPLGSGCLSASAALRGGGLTLSSLAGCQLQPEMPPEPDVITVASDAARGLVHGSLTSTQNEVLPSPHVLHRFFPLEEAGVISQTSLPRWGVAAVDDAPWARVAAVDSRQVPRLLRFNPPVLEPTEGLVGLGMAWRRTERRSLSQAEPKEPADDDARWRREALAEAMERDDGLASILSIVPG